MVESLTALIIVIALGLAVFSFALERILTGVAEADARGQVDEISELIEHDQLTPERMSEEVASHGSITQILDGTGRVLQASPASARSQPLVQLNPAVGVTQVVHIDNAPARAPQPWMVVARGVHPAVAAPGQTPDLVVLVAAPLKGESAMVRTTLWWFAGSAGVLLLVVGFLQWRGIAAALEPVRQITQEVDEIRHARSTRRVTQPSTDDEIAHLADVMNQMLARLDRADEVTRQFLSNASHELRSPLTTIRAVIEGESSPAGSRAHERDQVIRAEVLRMQRLVEDLLTLAKADDAGLDLAHAEVDLDGVVEQEVSRLRATTATTPLAIRAAIDAARVLGDEHRLAQVLRNLTDNAVRHARQVIDIRLCVDGKNAVLTVDNDGAPIAQAQRSAVFERFVRLSAARERDHADSPGGSGLGLAISQVIVEQHGGTIATGETTGGNCRFEVRLPLACDYLEMGSEAASTAGTMRYPAPRTVSSETTPKASSIFRRK